VVGKARTQTLITRDHNGLQRTSWQRRYFEKKPCFPFEVPRAAAETDTPSPADHHLRLTNTLLLLLSFADVRSRNGLSFSVDLFSTLDC